MNGLAFIPLPLPEESPTSLIKRAALRNGYKSVDKFLAFHRLDSPTQTSLLRQDSIVAEYLSKQAGKFAQSVTIGFYQASHEILSRPNLIINSIEIKKRLIRFNQAAICSECCKEGWERFIKDIKLADYCPYHHRKYISSCPKCQRKFTWRNQLTNRCKCGQEIESPLCTNENARPEEQLLRLLRMQNQQTMDLFTSTLRSLDFNSAQNDPETNREIFSTAIAIALEDKERIVTGLLRIFRPNTKIDGALIATKLPSLTPTHLIKFIIKKLSIHKPDPHAPSDINFSLTTQQLKNHLSITNAQWSLIRKNDLYPRNRRRISAYTLQDIKKINYIHELIISKRRILPSTRGPRRLMTLAAASKHLKISRTTLKELIHSNLLGLEFRMLCGPNTISAARVRDLNKKFICIQALSKESKISVHTIKKCIERLAIPVLPLKHESKHTIVIPRKYSKKIITTASGPLSSFEPKARHRLSAKLPMISDTKRSSYYSTAEASRIIEIDPTTTRQFIRKGILKSSHKAKFGSFLISKVAISEFNINYISVSEASKILRLPRNKTTAVLAAHGITPVTGKSVDNGKTTLFLRKEISSQIIEDITLNKHDFGKEHSNKSLITFKDACHLLGTSRISLSKILNQIILPLRPKHFQTIRSVSSSELIKIQDYIKKLTPIPTILEFYRIPSQSFSRRFLLGGYVTCIKINDTLYMDSTDKHKVIDILENYCTCKEADTILGVPLGFTRNLLKCGKIKPALLPEGISPNPIQFSRYQILQLKSQERLRVIGFTQLA